MLCVHYLRKQEFLTYKQSAKAAAAAILAINICLSQTAKVINASRIKRDKLKSLIYVALATHADSGVFEEIVVADGPLSIWNKQIEELTSVEKTRDIKQIYASLLSSVNTELFQNKLAKDPKLFI